jgi:hypothetical protein
MIKALFLLWTLILQGVMPASLWPTSFFGPLPVCAQPHFDGAVQMCGADPALFAFLDQLAVHQQGIVNGAAPIATMSPARISNGF